MFDIHNNLKMAVALGPVAITTDTTTAGIIIDRQDFEALEFVMQSGVLTDGDYAPKVEHGDESDLSDAAEVADDDLFGTEAGATLDADADDNKTAKIGYNGTKRYVRCSVVSTNTSSGALIGVLAILGHHGIKPDSTQQN